MYVERETGAAPAAFGEGCRSVFLSVMRAALGKSGACGKWQPRGRQR
jgi:hypothetical protein